MASNGAKGDSSSPKPASSLTADDLIRIFNDPNGELLHYPFKFGEVTGLNPGVFCMDVPFHAIKAEVEGVRKDIFENLDPNSPPPSFEHVGSTSIKGMPGYLSPDILIIEDGFPPSASTVRAIAAAGFNFISLAPHGENDYWFTKPVPADDIGPERTVVLHLLDKANPVGRVCLKLRDACNYDPKAFEEYKALKLAARGGSGSIGEYKLKKSQTGIIHRLRKEEGMPERRELHLN